MAETARAEPGRLMAGKRGLVMGVANDHSIAWGIAKTLAQHGAELAFTYQGEALGKRVTPLAQSLGSGLVIPCDVEDLASVDAVFDTLDKTWDGLDFVVHAIGFSDKSQLKGSYVDVTTRENFSRTMVISCFSFTEIAQRGPKAAELPMWCAADRADLVLMHFGTNDAWHSDIPIADILSAYSDVVSALRAAQPTAFIAGPASSFSIFPFSSVTSHSARASP